MVLSRKDFITSEKKQEKKTGDCGAEDGDSTEEPVERCSGREDASDTSDRRGGNGGRVELPKNRRNSEG